MMIMIKITYGCFKKGVGRVDPQLLVFIKVVETKSFTKAANKLHMTQPAVSQSVMNLEKRVGAKLIERTNKEFYLNKAGEVVYAYGKKIMGHYNQMELIINDLKHEPSGPLTIGASYTIGEYVLPEILVQLHKIYPNIIPNICIDNTEVIGNKLLHREIDIGLIEGEFDHPSIEKSTFRTDEMYIVSRTRKDLPIDHTVSSGELSTMIWLIREEGSGTRKITEQFLQTKNIQPKRLFTLGSTQIIKEAVEAGLGISLMSKWVLKKEIERGTVQQLKVRHTPVKRTFSFLKLSQAFESKAVIVFEQLIKQK